MLVAMIPSRPRSSARSATPRTSSSARSGAIFTSSGTRRRVARAVGGHAHRVEQRAELVDRLQVAQPGRVRRRDVDDQVVGVRREQAGALAVVGLDGGLVVVRHQLGLADVDAEHRSPRPAAGGDRQRGQPPRDRLGAVVVEAHPVHDRPVGGQPEQPRPIVARLRPRPSPCRPRRGRSRARPARRSRPRSCRSRRRARARWGTSGPAPRPAARVGAAGPAPAGRPGPRGSRGGGRAPGRPA